MPHTDEDPCGTPADPWRPLSVHPLLSPDHWPPSSRLSSASATQGVPWALTTYAPFPRLEHSPFGKPANHLFPIFQGILCCLSPVPFIHVVCFISVVAAVVLGGMVSLAPVTSSHLV